jgi:hypothetical protein
MRTRWTAIWSPLSVLASQWISAGREHAGMILAPQQRFSVGEQLRRLRLRTAMSTANMRNRAEFLGSWG